MSRRKPAPAIPQGDLFGAPKTIERDPTSTTIPMDVIGAGTRDAWLLRPAGSKGPAKFVARRLVKRGEGPRAHEFTMPRFLAVERGWL